MIDTEPLSHIRIARIGCQGRFVPVVLATGNCTVTAVFILVSAVLAVVLAVGTGEDPRRYSTTVEVILAKDTARIVAVAATFADIDRIPIPIDCANA